MKNDLIRAQFGARVRELRLTKGLSQEALAFDSDLDRSYMSEIELGLTNVSIETIEKLLNGLGVTFAEFFSGLKA